MTGSRAKRKNAPKVRTNVRKMPRFSALLGDPQAAREAAAWWRANVPELEAAGLLARVDDTLLIDAAVCVARIRQYEREIDRTGLTLVGAKGQLVRNPASITLASYRTALQGYLKALGMTPASRQGMDVKSPQHGLGHLDRIALRSALGRRGIVVEDEVLGRDDWDLDPRIPLDVSLQFQNRR